MNLGKLLPLPSQFLINSVAGGIIAVANKAGQQLFTLQNGLQNLARYFEEEADKQGELEVGDDGNNTLFGTLRSDTIFGFGGNDTIVGSGGHDELIGGDGKDVMTGSAGKDDLSGGTGNDRLDGGGGNDNLSGGDGDDALNGGKGNDVISGGAGADVMTGDDGRDTFSISFEDGSVDRITDFELGKDKLDLSGFKQLGANLKRGDFSIEKFDKNVYDVSVKLPLFGKPQPAFQVELSDKDAGRFLKLADLGLGDKTGIEAFGDVFEGLGGIFRKMADALKGTGLADLLSGGNGNDKLVGKGGDDRIDGGVGNDNLLGGGGDDLLEGGTGNDKLNGGGGNDRLDGGDGNDVLKGGGGDDWLQAGAGKDVINGGAGDDILIAGSGDTQMIGGKGADTFVFTEDSLKKMSTIMRDYNPEEDFIKLMGVEMHLPGSLIKDNIITLELQKIGDAVGSIGDAAKAIIDFHFSDSLLTVSELE